MSVSVKAAKALANVLQEDDEDAPVIDGKYKKLFEMDFMRRATEQKQKKAEDEAKSILRELQEIDGDSDEDDFRKDGKKDDDDYVVDEEESLPKRRIVKSGKSSSHDTTTIGKAGKVQFAPSTKEQQPHLQEIEKAIDSESNETILEPSVNPWLMPSSTGKVSHSAKDSKKVLEKAEKAISDNIIQKVTQAPSSDDMIPLNQSKKSKKSKNKAAAATGGATMETPMVESKKEESKEKKEDTSILGEKKALLMEKSQSDLVQTAFAGPDLESEFINYKEQLISDELGFDDKRKDVIKNVKAGWGDWAAPGSNFVSKKIQNIRDRQLKKIGEEEESKKAARTDTKIKNVMISEKRVKTSAKYKIADIPHPFSSREEYEQAMRMPVGGELNEFLYICVSVFFYIYLAIIPFVMISSPYHNEDIYRSDSMVKSLCNTLLSMELLPLIYRIYIPIIPISGLS